MFTERITAAEALAIVTTSLASQLSNERIKLKTAYQHKKQAQGIKKALGYDGE